MRSQASCSSFKLGQKETIQERRTYKQYSSPTTSIQLTRKPIPSLDSDTKNRVYELALVAPATKLPLALIQESTYMLNFSESLSKWDVSIRVQLSMCLKYFPE